MTGSKLVTEIYPADISNYTAGRTAEVKEIIVHHMAAVASAAACGAIFARPHRNGSSHYGIGKSGEIAQYVSESDTAWDSPHYRTGISIENANCERGGEWKVSDETLSSLIKLVADIAERYGLYPLIAGKNLTWHSMYDATACPGDYLRGRMAQIAEEANKIIEEKHMVDFNTYPGNDNIPADWSKDDIEWAVKNNILRGDERGLRLRDTVTREEMCAFLRRVYELRRK